MVRYQVHLSRDKTVTLDAAKVNTGTNWLWFFDGDNDLIGLYYWRNIMGFSVEGSAHGQVITDRIPIDMGTVAPEEWSEGTRLYFEDVRHRREQAKTPEVHR